MSDIADIKINVDAHLCIYASRTALCQRLIIYYICSQMCMHYAPLMVSVTAWKEVIFSIPTILKY
jgi:hypothetical protein